MDHYALISRKYRPQRFADVIGQDVIVTTLKNSLKAQRVGRAYLFCGSRGTGKTTFARLLAKALNCKHANHDHEPCNHCSSCQEISQSRSLDVIEIDGASHRGIDDIRNLSETMQYASSGSLYKIFIIDEVHMLTKEAFNALLKTLEEPPAHVKFFFATTEPHKIPSTILSRCQRFDLRRIATDQMVAKLGAIAKECQRVVEEGVLMRIALASEGSLRDAESLFDQLCAYCTGPITIKELNQMVGWIGAEIWKALDQAVQAQEISMAFTTAKQLFDSGLAPDLIWDQLLNHFRNHLAAHIDPTSLLPSDAKTIYNRSIYSRARCYAILDYLMVSRQKLGRTSLSLIDLELALLYIFRLNQEIDLATLILRLEDLEKKLSTPESSPPTVEKALCQEEAKVEPIPSTSSPETSKISSARWDTLIRFAAVELEATIKKES